MGCDGGTIPTRDELVKLKKKPEQKDADAVRLLKWAHCALSQQVLAKKGVVACEMGRLYNKEAVIEMLLNKDRSASPPWASHIEKLKDVVELDLTINPAYEAKRKDAVGDGMYQDKLVSRYQCPVTGLEMNGRFKFVFSWTTGRVVSERAMKVLRNDPDEADKFKEEDSVVINPTEEEIDEQIVKMEARRARVKAEKKAAKAAKKGIASAQSAPTPSGPTSAVAANEGFKRPGLPGDIQEVSSDQSLTEEPLAKKKKTEDDVKAFKDQGKGKKSKKEGEEKKESSSVPKKVFNPLAEQRRKEKEQDATPAREGPKVKKADCRADGDLKAINKSSIQQGNKSEVFKKLFTSHESAQNLPKGHWVTFDPRYHF